MRYLAPGSRLDAIFGSLDRTPDFAVLLWNPHRVTLSEVVRGVAMDPPLDVTAFVESVELSENIGFENADDPAVPQATFTFRRNPNSGINLRRGMVEDGVIVRILQGDRRVAREDWVAVFTGTFRGRPGDNPGTRSNRSEGMSATAYGREERFLNLQVTTSAFPRGTDLGDIAYAIASDHMGLAREEVLIGTQGFQSRHESNQLVEEPALSALWHCLFPVGKKPKFDGLGRLVAADARLDKPAVRVYSAGDPLVVSNVAAPTDVEVNNSVALTGLASDLSKVMQEVQMLVELSVVTGFFDRRYHEDVFYSDDRSQRAEGTYLVEKNPISWSKGEWSEEDEFHGRLSLDTRYLANVRMILFASFLAVQIAVAAIDYYFHEGGIASNVVNWITGGTIGTVRLILQVLSIGTLVGLLWSMSYIGRGVYQVWGRPFEYCYQELMSRHQLVGLAPEEVRELELRNDFLSTMADLDAACFERLRRELVKNQVHEMTVLDDPVLEVDDVVETAAGDRFYVTSIRKTLRRGAAPTMDVSALKVAGGDLAAIDALELAQEVA